MKIELRGFMKKYTRVILLVMMSWLGLFSSAAAQTSVEEIDSLQVSFWPDFDRPSILVLMNGELPAGTTLPVEVTIPIPPDAEVNAVAESDEGQLFSIEYVRDGNALTFVTRNPRFLVEYYVPYEADGASRSYAFDWQADIPVANFAVEIQQPANATDLESDPTAVDTYTSQIDGLLYHVLSAQSLPANTPYRMSFAYEMTADALTRDPAGQAAPPAVQQPAAGQPPAPAAAEGNNWLLLAGVVGLVALAMGGTWYAATRSSVRKSQRPLKPSPRKTTTAKAPLYCHNCGQAAAGVDRYCRHCGTELKR